MQWSKQKGGARAARHTRQRERARASVMSWPGVCGPGHLKDCLLYTSNGHIPVRAASGEQPVKAGGKLIVIDGGFCKAYHQDVYKRQVYRRKDGSYGVLIPER